MKQITAIVLEPKDFTVPDGNLRAEAFNAIMSGAVVVHDGRVLNFGQGSLLTDDSPSASSKPRQKRTPRKNQAAPEATTPSPEGNNDTPDTQIPPSAQVTVRGYDEELADSVLES